MLICLPRLEVEVSVSTKSNAVAVISLLTLWTHSPFYSSVNSWHKQMPQKGKIRRRGEGEGEKGGENWGLLPWNGLYGVRLALGQWGSTPHPSPQILSLWLPHPPSPMLHLTWFIKGKLIFLIFGMVLGYILPPCRIVATFALLCAKPPTLNSRPSCSYISLSLAMREALTSLCINKYT